MTPPNTYDFLIIGAIVLVVGSMAFKPIKADLGSLWGKIFKKKVEDPKPVEKPIEVAVDVHTTLDHWLAIRSLPVVATNQEAIIRMEWVLNLVITSVGKQ